MGQTAAFMVRKPTAQSVGAQRSSMLRELATPTRVAAKPTDLSVSLYQTLARSIAKSGAQHLSQA